MDPYRTRLDPEEMTPEERMEWVVAILANAVIKTAYKQQGSLNIHQEESSNTSSHQDVSIQKSKNNLFPIRAEKKKGSSRFGFKEQPDGRLTVDGRNIVIKIINEMIKQGISTRKIASRLNAEGYKTGRNKKWSGTAVWRILQGQRDVNL